MLRPVAMASTSAGSRGDTMPGRGTRALTILDPAASARSLRQTASTSGSSGIRYQTVNSAGAPPPHPRIFAADA